MFVVKRIGTCPLAPKPAWACHIVETPAKAGRTAAMIASRIVGPSCVRVGKADQKGTGAREENKARRVETSLLHCYPIRIKEEHQSKQHKENTTV